MNVPSHASGQMVPNQRISRLSGLSQQNGGIGGLASQMQNVGGITNIDPEFALARSAMLERINQYFQGRPLPNGWHQKLPDIVKRFEEWLFKHASSKEEYLNMETFESRMRSIIKKITSTNQQFASCRVSSSAPISTMIPTPGMPHGGSSNVMATGSADTTVTTSSSPGAIVATSMGTGNMIQTANQAAPIGTTTSFIASDVSNSDGYQHPSANSSVGSVPAMGLSHGSSQMIPTPGLTNKQSMPLNAGSNGGGYSGVESTTVHQSQKQFIANQNNQILQNLGGQIGVGVRNSMQQRYGFPNGGVTYVGSNTQLRNGNGPAVSEGYLSTSAYNNSPKPSQQHFDLQHQHTLRPRNNFGVNNVTLTGAGNVRINAPTMGSTMNSQNMNLLNLQPRSKPSTTPQSYQQNLQSIPQTARKPQFLDTAQKLEFQSTHSVQESYLQTPQSFPKFQQQHYQSQTSQSYGQISQHQFHPQQQLLIENDPFGQPLVTSGINGQLMSEKLMASINEPLLPQASEEFRLSELPGFHQNSVVENSSIGTRSVSQLSGPQNMQPSVSQDLQQKHQIYHPNQHSVESENKLNSLSNGSQAEVLPLGHWHSRAPQKSHILDQTSFQNQSQSDFQLQMIEKSGGPQLHYLSEGSGPTVVIGNGMAMSKQSSSNSRAFGNSFRAKQYYNQQRWLLFLHHARYCGVPKGKCKESYCAAAQDLLVHMGKCNEENCTYRNCRKTKAILKHFFECQNADCPVCVFVRDFSLKYKSHPLSDAGCVEEQNAIWKTVNAVDADKPGSKTSSSSIEPSVDPQSSKRQKMDHRSVSPNGETGKLHASQEAHMVTYPQVASVKSEASGTKIESSTHSVLENPPTLRQCNIDGSEYTSSLRPSVCQDKLEKMQTDKDFSDPKTETKQEIAAPSVDFVSSTKSGKPKVKGVSLTELFTPEQVREHIIGLRRWVGQSKAKAEKNQAMERSMSENSCQLCAVEKLTFDPPPIYCSICGARIKRNAMFYTFGSSDTRQYFCIPCHNEARGDSIEVEGNAIPKAKLEKKRNDEEIEEWWVQCDKCEAWQHQICALFNGRRNERGQAEYTCPNCYVQEVERGERKPLPQSAVLGADDLPKTLLSDHLEQRLLIRLKQERQERARLQGRSFDEVPGAEALVVRVVSSVDKKLDVKQRFLEIFQEDNYPTEFPYKSKVVLLFQKIEGVEVCLFGMYVQEFGSECQFPNQRRVYLSYLDSVKYFRPEIKAVTGEALRTFVYHEILIGYLEYCKKRGFTSCYIWACPPLKGEDYILYCHPEIQKTPKSDKLREWYLSMLRKARKEDIVVDLTNLYDHFFVTMGECKAKVTAARLPYFDGDYWPGAAEDMINQLQQEQDGRKQQKKGKTKKTITKRALKAAGQTDLSENASKDLLLMQKLGETISPMKEDFIMVHLQHACTHCCVLMVSGFRWVCNLCKNFQLCEKCYEAEQKREERERHPINSREKHLLLKPVQINDVPSDTKDRDEILESEFFDTRQAFLSLCQGNHYQYDTLRRAKHSSMMVLYHLHNPTAPAFVTTCNICQRDIETGQGWRCETCADFDVCNNCYKKGVEHPHKLTTHPSMMDAQNTESRQKRVAELRKMLNLLVHASQCRVSPHQSVQCQYPDCRKVKGLFRHGRICKTRASGGCVLCKRMWYLLQLHARACKESECHVPRCRDLKEHLRRLQQQSDSRRRAAVMEMMRQRAAEVAASS